MSSGCTSEFDLFSKLLVLIEIVMLVLGILLLRKIEKKN